MRSSGILMHISSLPSPYGIGTFGRAAYEFVDFLEAAGQGFWQILPINPTSYGDSPYQSPSAFAGNPYFIDLDLLRDEGLLEWGDFEDIYPGEPDSIAFGPLYENRYRTLRRALYRFEADRPADYEEFCRTSSQWLDGYTLFMALKEKHGGAPWRRWESPFKFRDEAALIKARIELDEEIRFWGMLQYLFFKQWRALKEYANHRGISIIGDLPIYVADDSADVWSNPRCFLLNEELEPTFVAGCPPDGFTEDGQLWGNPLFDWDAMRAGGYSWWIQRLRHMSELYDVTRIDHFRGFDSYYAIPAGSPDAKYGQWRPGPGMELFDAVREELGDISVIAEDLGFLTDSVRQLLRDTGFPGMKVLEFAFDSREGSDYLPHTYEKNCVAYTGTHDNDTVAGWLASAPQHIAEYAAEYLRLNREEGMCQGVMNALWASAADLSIVQMQDILGLGSSARMNIPSTTDNNWSWRMPPGAPDAELSRKLRRTMRLYARSR